MIRVLKFLFSVGFILLSLALIDPVKFFYLSFTLASYAYAGILNLMMYIMQFSLYLKDVV